MSGKIVKRESHLFITKLKDIENEIKMNYWLKLEGDFLKIYFKREDGKDIDIAGTKGEVITFTYDLPQKNLTFSN